MNVSRVLLEAALRGFEQQKAEIEGHMANIHSELASPVEVMRDDLNALRKTGNKLTPVVERRPKKAVKTRKMTAAGRKAIADASRKRWAEYRAAKGSAA